ncbi:MAG: hypothetical protein ACLP36_10620 [Acidimicrobiales bacterium]
MARSATATTRSRGGGRDEEDGHEILRWGDDPWHGPPLSVLSIAEPSAPMVAKIAAVGLGAVYARLTRRVVGA